MTKISKLLFLICICVFTVICYNVISYNRLAFDLPVQRFAFSLKTLSYTKIMVPPYLYGKSGNHNCCVSVAYNLSKDPG